MPVFRWGRPWFDFQNLEQEVDRLLRRVPLFQGFRVGRQFPLLNLYEGDGEYLLTAELPGYSSEQIELTLAAGILTLKGERTADPDVPESAYRRVERHQGPWQRAVSLPERVDEEGLSAGFRDGVLIVRLPKAEASSPRQIPVTGDQP